MESMNHETLNQVQGDKIVVMTESLDGGGTSFWGIKGDFDGTDETKY
jgi:hypothetical protein